MKFCIICYLSISTKYMPRPQMPCMGTTMAINKVLQFP